jgi:regulator of ribonuclease activity A
MCFGHTDSPEEKHMSTAEPSATADLYDEHGENLQSCDLQMRQYGATRSFAGTITTVRCFEDNALVKSILGEDGEGRVLVVDGGGSIHTALMGDMIAKIAMTNRWAGVVINGAVRDVAVLAELPIGIKALGSNPRKSAKSGAGDREIVVAFGGTTFRPGDTLYSDDDGVVVLPRTS